MSRLYRFYFYVGAAGFTLCGLNCVVQVFVAYPNGAFHADLTKPLPWPLYGVLAFGNWFLARWCWREARALGHDGRLSESSRSTESGLTAAPDGEETS
jgi:hypothetical protein